MGYSLTENIFSKVLGDVADPTKTVILKPGQYTALIDYVSFEKVLGYIDWEDMSGLVSVG
jgi:hypothetical protein